MSMATSLSSVANQLPPFSKLGPPKTSSSNIKFNNYISSTQKGRGVLIPNVTVLSIKCESSKDETPKTHSTLEIGSPVVVVEAPKTIKTAASVPCLRVNTGLVNPGDVGRIVSRKPKDVWAIRLSIGTYLIDGKYFKPLKVDQ